VDINILPKLLRAEDKVIFGDASYTSDEYKRGARQLRILACARQAQVRTESLEKSEEA